MSLEYVTADNYTVDILNDDLLLVNDYRSQKTSSAEKEFFRMFSDEMLTKAFNRLDARQKKYISFRFGLDEYDSPHNRTETAEYFGLTYEKATEIEKSAIVVLRREYFKT